MPRQFSRVRRLIDQERDACIGPQSFLDPRQVRLDGKIACKRLDPAAGCICQAFGKRRQPALIARDRDQVVATSGQHVE
jgi:hypothetical protein